MPLFSGDRPNETSIEYTAVSHDVNHNTNDDTRGDQFHGNTVEVTRQSVDINDQDSSRASKSKGTNYQVFGSSRAASEETPARLNAPAITGWPQGPRRLKGVSIPFLIGDTLLILLPIAFLGKYASLSGQDECKILITSSLGHLCMAT